MNSPQPNFKVPPGASAHRGTLALALAGSLAGAALLAAGCATKPAREAPPEGSIVLQEGEFEYVNVTGSRVPVLVPKGQAARAAALAGSPVLRRSVEALESIRNHADNVGK